MSEIAVDEDKYDALIGAAQEVIEYWASDDLAATVRALADALVDLGEYVPADDEQVESMEGEK